MLQLNIALCSFPVSGGLSSHAQPVQPFSAAPDEASPQNRAQQNSGARDLNQAKGQCLCI